MRWKRRCFLELANPTQGEAPSADARGLAPEAVALRPSGGVLPAPAI